MTKKRIHLIYKIVLSISLFVMGFCLMVACVGIYLSGDRAFTRESVAAAFSGIAVPVYLCLALMIGGLILDSFYPTESKKQVPEKQYHAILSRLLNKLDMPRCDADLQQQIQKQRKQRRLHKIISLILLALGTVIFLCYSTNGSHFDQQDVTGSMIKAMYWFVPCLFVPFAYGVFAAYQERISLQREIELVKQAIVNAPAEARAQTQTADKNKLFLGLRVAILCVIVAVIVFGFLTGGTNDVLTKAINICTECVGLG